MTTTLPSTPSSPLSPISPSTPKSPSSPSSSKLQTSRPFTSPRFKLSKFLLLTTLFVFALSTLALIAPFRFPLSTSFIYPQRFFPPFSKSPDFTAHYHAPPSNSTTAEILALLETRLAAADQQPPPRSNFVRVSRGFTVDPYEATRGYTHLPKLYEPLCLGPLARVPYQPPAKPPCLSVVSNAFIGASGVILHPATSSIYDLGGGCCSDTDWKDYVNTTVTFTEEQMRTVRPGRVVLSLSQHHGSTYHHVIHELIPRYLSVLPLIEETELLVVIDESDVTPLLLTRILKLPKHRLRIRPYKESDWLFAGLILVPPSVFGHQEDGFYPKEIVHATAEVLRDAGLGLGAVSRDRPASGKRVIILMERALQREEDGRCQKNRCMRNFAELKRKIEETFGDEFDVKVYGPRETVDQAVRLFPEADVVVGFHGAGFQNMMFCRKGITVVHIGWGDHYRDLAEEFGLRYHLSLAEGTNRDMKSIEVDVGKVVKEMQVAIVEDDQWRATNTTEAV